MGKKELDFEKRDFKELSPKQKAKLRKSPVAWNHAKNQRPFYLKIAKEVIDLSKKFKGFKHPETRISVVANWIEELDPAVQQLATAKMDVTELCELYARTVVGHEDEIDE